MGSQPRGSDDDAGWPLSGDAHTVMARLDELEAEMEQRITSLRSDTLDAEPIGGSSAIPGVHEVDDERGNGRSRAEQVVQDVVIRLQESAQRVGDAVPVAAERSRDLLTDVTSNVDGMPTEGLWLGAGLSAGLAAGASISGAPRLLVVALAMPLVLFGRSLMRRERPTPGARLAN